MCKNIKNWDWITILYFVFIIVSILAINCIVCHIKSLSNTSTVLAFIGILATFVVVSNYAQLLEIKKDCRERINRLQIDIDLIKDTVDSVKVYFDNEIINQIIRILKKYGIQPYFTINKKDIVAISPRADGKFLIEIKLMKKIGNQIIPGESVSHYYLVDINKEECSEMTIEEYNKELKKSKSDNTKLQ